MEELEKHRLELLGYSDNAKHGLIIPIIYRGNKRIPHNISSKRQCYFFEDYQISGHATLDYPEYAQKIKEIAEYIEERCEELSAIEDGACCDCDTFSIPSEGDIFEWLEGMLPPRPKLPSRAGII